MPAALAPGGRLRGGPGRYVRDKTGHALIGARQWVPAENIADPVKSLVTALPLDLRFRTKGQLAVDVLEDACVMRGEVRSPNHHPKMTGVSRVRQVQKGLKSTTRQ